jgi:hypothetical protein
MAERKDIDDTSGKAATPPEPAPSKIELPTVESPSISPATPEPAIEPVAAAAPAIEPVAAETPAPATAKRFTFNVQHQRNALLAASVAIAAALGAIVGAVATGGFAPPERIDVAGLEETKAMQQSIARMAKEITTLKSSVEAANKSAHTQIAKIGDKITERFDRAGAADITGSISAPQTTTPLPSPRPAPRAAAVDIPQLARPPVVQGWTIRDARDGFVYVEGHGEVYQVVPGAPLPGLGAVESIRRQDGRWVVVTPRGIIVSMRDRRFFGSF